MNTQQADDLKTLIRDVPDFPKKGIVFKDITTLLRNGKAFASAVRAVAHEFQDRAVTSVVCVEARGFVLGSAVAYALGCGFVPVRKKGKLPCETYEVSYELEYGTDYLQIHKDALSKEERILVVDDLLATGGTMTAVMHLLENFKTEIVGIAFLVELTFLKGRNKLKDRAVFSLIQY